MRTTLKKWVRRNETQPLNRQRGFLLITAVVMIVVAALLLTVMLFLGATGNESSAGHSQSKQALFVAETGMERALYDFKNGTACASLSYSGVSIGQGSFTATGTLYSPAGTTLSSNINATDTYIPVASVAGYATHGRITIGSEAINYTGTSASSCGAFTPPCFTGVTRGAAGTTAAAHTSGTSVSQNQCVIRSVGSVNSASRTVERAISSSGASAGAMAVYAKLNGDGLPYYRIWDGSAWGTEASATSVVADIRFLVLKFARTRNEAILVSQNSSGQIRAQVWNGTSWSDGTTPGATRLLGTIANGGDRNYRAFDVEYETSGDRAVVVYRNGDNADPDYQIWTGSVWVAAATISGNATTGRPRWIELAPNPASTSDEIAMILVDHNDDVYGMRWNGSTSTWDNMGVAGVWDVADDSRSKTIDVAYEQQSSRALFIWADDSNGDQRYRLWNGLALSGMSTLDLGNIPGFDMTGRGEWVRLAPRTGSNQILYGVQDDNDDLFTALWDGASSWGSGTRHDGSIEAGNDRNFDIVFETYAPNTHLAWLVWGNGWSLSRKQWNSTTSSWGGTTTTGDDTALVQLMAHPTSGVVLAAIYEDRGASTDDLREMHLPAGGAWSPLTNPSTTPADPFWAGQTVNNPVLERVTLAPYRFGFEIYDWIEVYP